MYKNHLVIVFAIDHYNPLGASEVLVRMESDLFT